MTATNGPIAHVTATYQQPQKVSDDLTGTTWRDGRRADRLVIGRYGEASRNLWWVTGVTSSDPVAVHGERIRSWTAARASGRALR